MGSSILGSRVLRKEDPTFLTAGGTYADDLRLEGAAHVTFVRSTAAHARISVDAGALDGMPGVLGVFTAEDLDLDDLPAGFPGVDARMARPPLARGVARFAGDIVAALVTESRAQGADAAELVAVDYDFLPVVVDPEEAARDHVLLFPETGTNVCAELPAEDGEEFFDGCEVVVVGRSLSQRLAPCPLESRAAAAVWGEDGRLTAWTSTQTPHGARDQLAKTFGLEPGQVRVIAPDVGGGFGAKAGVGAEEILVAWLARRVGRPARWVEGRSESMVGLGHGRGQLAKIELGGTRDGKVLAYRLTILQDAGAYPNAGAFLPFLTRTMASGVYAIPKIAVRSRSVVTNTTPTVAYRGAGRPEATQAIERAMEIFALELGLDPAEVRRQNFIPAGAFPYTTASGATYDTGAYERALEVLLGGAGYDELRAEQRRRSEEGVARRLGIGISVYVEITNPFSEPELGSVEITPEGTARVRTGSSPHGQGHVTSFSMLAADRLGLPFEAIEVVHGDTDAVPRGVGTYGSRSLQAGGSAVAGAAEVVVLQAQDLVAELLEANPADVVLDRSAGRFHVAGSPERSVSWAELARVAHVDRQEPERLSAELDFKPEGATWPFGAHLAVVEVDTETGEVELLRLVAVDDSGRILNPLIAEGQRHGGIAQGIAQALHEEFVYDADGNPLTASFLTYAFPSAAELPSFELLALETPTPLNELGAKGIGESGTIGSTPAVLSAVIDALAPLGVRHVDMPATPERVWRALSEAAPPPPA